MEEPPLRRYVAGFDVLDELRALNARASYQPDTRANSELLDELRAAVADQPRSRLHVHPGAAMWIAISVRNTGLDEHVQVVADPACHDAGRGWIETVSVEQWRAVRALVGHRVTVSTADLGDLTGTLLALDHHEARLDLGDGDVRYLPWLAIQPAPQTLAGEAGR